MKLPVTDQTRVPSVETLGQGSYLLDSISVKRVCVCQVIQ